MISALTKSKRIVFILGAGASFHLDYPLGPELVKEIIDNFIPPAQLKWGNSDVEIFKKALRKSGLSSIDAFLAKINNFVDDRVKYLDIGLVAIAQCLLSKEKLYKLESSENNWYNYLWSKIHYDRQKLIDGSIAFINFNYDLSLEQFLYSAVRYNWYGETLSREREARLNEFANKIPVVHMYGKLGTLKWQDSSGGKAREYGEKPPINKHEFIWDISRNIKVIRDNDDVGADFQKAQKILEQATHIYFLGFGYDKTNLERLNVYEKIRQGTIVKIAGTAIGLGGSEQEQVRSCFNRDVRDALVLQSEKNIIEFLKYNFDGID